MDGVIITDMTNIKEVLTTTLGPGDNSTPGITQRDPFKEAVTFLNVYLTPVIVIVGFVTNSLAACVFLGTSLRHQSSSIYLAALAIVDTGFLMTVFTNWFTWITEQSFHQAIWCQLIIYFAYVFGFLSVWFLLAFTVERYIAVCHPFVTYTMCSTKRAKIVICAISAFAAVGYNFALWTSRVIYFNDKPFCLPREEFMQAVNIAAGIDGVLTMIVPSVVIVLLNLRIGIRIYSTHWHHGKQPAFSNVPATNGTSGGRGRTSSTTTMTNPTASASTSSVNGRKRTGSISIINGRKVSNISLGILRKTSNTSLGSGRKRSNSSTGKPVRRSSSGNSLDVRRGQKHRAGAASPKTNRLLFMVSAVFLLLNGPSHAIRTYYMYRQMASVSFRPSRLGIQLQECFQFFFYINFSVNFFLYSFGAKRFRAAMFQFWRKAVGRVRFCWDRKSRIGGSGGSQRAAHSDRRGTGPEHAESLTLVSKK